MNKIRIVKNGGEEARQYATPYGCGFRSPYYTSNTENLLGELAASAGGVLLLDEVEKFSEAALSAVCSYLSQMREDVRPVVFLSYHSEEPPEVLRAFSIMIYNVEVTKTVTTISHLKIHASSEIQAEQLAAKYLENSDPKEDHDVSISQWEVSLGATEEVSD